MRKSYDSSISDSVKQANSLSTPAAQAQKQAWLENREIFNSVLDTMSQGLDKESAVAFKEMSLLYEARNNIIDKFKIDTKGTSGIVSPKNAVRATIGGTAAGLLIP